MTKPFVVITPEADREVLRNAGVLPGGFFRNFDVDSNGLRGGDGATEGEGIPPVYMWPYNLPYQEDLETYEDGLFKPDVPRYFGLGKPGDDAEKRHNERLITGLLSSVMVHVVFLDTRRSAKGYAVFRSFGEIVKWGKSLRRALNVRFRNEEILQSMESVLVVVARGEQATLRASDIEAFNECVQQSRDDVWVDEETKEGRVRQRKIFQSCYFLDYNLCVRDSRELYHSAEIWDLMVGRLLLAFLLSRGSNACWWQIPGVKLWRSQDCSALIDAESDRRLVDEVLSRANAAIQDLAAKSEGLHDLPLFAGDPEPTPLLYDTPLEPEETSGLHWRWEPKSGWSDYDAKTCVEKTCDPGNQERWLPAFNRVKKAFLQWKVHRDRAPGEDLVASVFKAVHSAPGNLLRAVARIYSKLAKADLGAGTDPEQDWVNLAETEVARQNAARQLAIDAAAFTEAKRHYVGLAASLMVLAAVGAALGAVCYYVTHCICLFFGFKVWWERFSIDPVTGAKTLLNKIPIADAVFALGPFALSMLGAILAASLMYLLHRRAGERAMARLVEESEAVDALMVKRDGKARVLVMHGKAMRDGLRLQGLRFRTWALLKRTQDILVTELQPAVSQTSSDVKDEEHPEEMDERRSVRETFLSRTRHSFGPYRIAMKEGLRQELERQVARWWSESAPPSHMPPSETTNFSDLWFALCEDDMELAGYFPARPFSSELRSFVSRFTDAARHVARSSVLADHFPEIRAGVFDWYEKLQSEEYYLYASGAVTGEHVNEDGMENARVYFANSSVIDREELEALRKGSQADRSRFLPECRQELNQTSLLALLYQEIRVRFGTDASGDELGRLTFKVIPDIVGDDND